MGKKVAVFRREHFNAAHRLFNPVWPEEKNKQVFGICSSPNFHGHNYEMDVTVAGDINPELGYVMDLTELRKLVDKEIIDKVDHKNLNLDVDFMNGVLPSTENIAVTFWNQLEKKINAKNRKLYSIKIRETVNNSVEYKGNN